MYGLGFALSRKAKKFRSGPDGTIVSYGGLIWGNAEAWTTGDMIMMKENVKGLSLDKDIMQPTLNHEYAHTLSIRRDGPVQFYATYLVELIEVSAPNLVARPTDIWHHSPYERDISRAIDKVYEANPTLPHLSEFPVPPLINSSPQGGRSP